MSATYEEAFLEDVIAHPEDDAPRLIYADWLDEQGEGDRADFIRVQHALAQLPPGDARRTPLLKRQGDLLGTHEDEWRASLPRLEGVTWEDFSRGFVEAAFVDDVPTLVVQAPALFAAAPVLRLQIGEITAATVGALAGSPWLARLRELNLGNNPDLGSLGGTILAGSPHLAGLWVLLLHYCALGDEAIARLSAAAMPRLTELYLSGNELNDAAAVALADSGNFPLLTDLDLRDNQIGDGGAVALAHQADLPQLLMLYLTNNRIGADGAEALAFSGGLPKLARLWLNYNRIGNGGAAAFASSPRRSGLRELDLRHCDVRNEGARALADSPHLDGLESIWLGGNRIPLETLTLLRRRFGERVRF
jgi:uncharacterized protein (TIGR02996 family)